MKCWGVDAGIPEARARTHAQAHACGGAGLLLGAGPQAGLLSGEMSPEPWGRQGAACVLLGLVLWMDAAARGPSRISVSAAHRQVRLLSRKH